MCKHRIWRLSGRFSFATEPVCEFGEDRMKTQPSSKKCALTWTLYQVPGFISSAGVVHSPEGIYLAGASCLCCRVVRTPSCHSPLAECPLAHPHCPSWEKRQGRRQSTLSRPLGSLQRNKKLVSFPVLAQQRHHPLLAQGSLNTEGRQVPLELVGKEQAVTAGHTMAKSKWCLFALQKNTLVWFFLPFSTLVECQGFPCRSESPTHLYTSRHIAVVTQQAEYVPYPSQRHSITPNSSWSKSMLPARRAALEGSGHSFRTWVRFRPVHDIINLHSKRAGTARATWATFSTCSSPWCIQTATESKGQQSPTQLSFIKPIFLVLIFSNSQKQHTSSTSVKSRHHPKAWRSAWSQQALGRGSTVHFRHELPL